MSKKFVDVLGLKRGSTPEVVATFSNRTLANWHIRNTFEGQGYDRLLVRNTAKKGDVFINDVVAEDKETYIKTLATMNITDLETVVTSHSEGTLLEFILNGDIAGKSGLNKLVVVEDEEQKEDEENLTKSLITVHLEDEPLGISKIKTRLAKELLDDFVGEGEDGEDEEEKVEKEEPKKETKKTTKKKDKPKKEETKKEEVVEEEVEDVTEEETEEVEELEELEDVEEDVTEEEVEEIEEEDVEELEEDDLEEVDEGDVGEDVEELSDEDLAELEDLGELEELEDL